MTNEVITPEGEAVPMAASVPRVKPKREIFRFNGDRPTAINLDHVNLMYVEGKKITFQFYSTATFIELADDAAANSVFDALLNAWVGEA